jgi:hypothetical protein
MLHLLKRTPASDDLIKTFEKEAEDDVFKGIRCPLCEWRPDAHARWSCIHRDSPEPPFPACGTVWNTFVTAGRCPGCNHQWQWTSCLSCGGWSKHVDWYEEGRP